jgi:predicted ATPase/class 3 adenylate cyclase/tRNA A-37 threonylcarbamoyl transferase component Bud32
MTVPDDTMATARYQLGERLHQGRRFAVFRAFNLGGGERLAVKRSIADYPTRRTLNRLQTEFDLLRRLGDHPGVPDAVALEPNGNGMILIRAFVPGPTLAELLQTGPMALKAVLRTSISLCATLEAVHGRQIIHKDVNPKNIVVDPETCAATLIDFDLSSLMPRESQAASAPASLEGTLAYMSPEQTGRMNRSLDYRTDLYSLGCTMFEMLTGRPPFDALEPIEIVHRHLAQTPTPPEELRSGIPSLLSRIVLRLMAKAAEDRYQSAHGLMLDLERLQTALDAGEPSPDFRLGADDVSPRFGIPQKLYGRQKETEELLRALDNAATDRPTLLLVSGYSGVGKSRLVYEVQRALVARRGFFVSGKFDQFNRAVPFASLHEALRRLAGQILTEPDEQIARWREQLLSAVGSNGRLIIDAIPEIETIIGPQPGVPELPPLESQNRFQRVFRDFVGAFCSPAHPLVIFLDDLQWVDSSTLDWIESALGDRGMGALFLIGAFRDNEVGVSHPLALTLERLPAAGAAVQRLELHPLSEAVVEELVADTLHAPRDGCRDLVHLVFRRTGGNPFFVNQLLESLSRDGSLVFDADRRRWSYDIERVRTAAASDDVVDLMLERLHRLPDATLEVLKLSACIGSQFDLDTLEVVTGLKAVELTDCLWPALEQGLVLRPVGAATDETELYRFLHDRVEQAAYSLMPEDEARRARLRIGRLLRDGIEDLEEDPRLFNVLQHLNATRGLITDPSERTGLARLNLAAAKRARQSTAYGPALKHAITGMELAPDSSAGDDAELTFELALERAECERLSGHEDKAQRFYNISLDRAENDEQMCRVYQAIIDFLTKQARFLEAYATSRRAAAHFGIHAPTRFSPLLLVLELFKFKRRIRRRRLAELIDLPLIEGDRLEMGARLLSASVKAAYQIRPELAVSNAATLVNLSLDHGNFADNPPAYLAFGCVFRGALLYHPDEGRAWGQLVLGLCERPRSLRYKSEVNFVYGYFTHSWTRPFEETEQFYRASYRAGIDTGDHFHAACACTGLLQSRFMRGANLAEIWDESERLIDFVGRVNAEENLGTLHAIRQAIRNLQGLTNASDSFGDSEFDEAAFVADLPNWGSPHFAHIYFANRLQTRVLWRELDAATELMRAARPFQKASTGLQHSVQYLFYSGLLLAELASDPGRRSVGQGLALRRIIGRFRKWAAGSRQNYGHMLALLQAELARLGGRHDRAVVLFDRAIEAAAAAGYQQIEALACERAGRHYLSQGRTRTARFYLKDAMYGYARWGAVALAGELRNRYPVIADAGVQQEATESASIAAESAPSLDLRTVIKSYQVLSREVRLRDLLTSLVGIVMENAGARRCVLVMGEGADYIIRAEGTADGGEVNLLEDTPLADYDGLPKTVVQFVIRKRESVILNDATAAGQFVGDPYVASTKARSILCSPLLNQGRLTGVLYLENDLTTGAFTDERVQLLELLSAQIAISVSNGELYAKLEDKVRERTEQLEIRNRFIRQAFGRYLSDDVVEGLLEKPEGLSLGGEKRKVTILMSDLRGFTSVAQALQAERVVALINNYLGVMTDTILAHQGTIDEFIGDAILAVFGAPYLRSDDAERAVACAVAMQQAIDEVNDWNREQGLPEISMGIGINTGEVVVGNIGSAKRAKYGVVGNAVNMASRIESYTVGGQILISEDTLAEVGAELRIDDRITVQPKGSPKAMTLYDVGGIDGVHRRFLVKSRSRMIDLHRPIAVRFTVINGKDTSGRLEDGRVPRLSTTHFELETKVPVEPMTNLRLGFTGLGGEASKHDVYAKVVPNQEGSDTLTLSFTSLPEVTKAELVNMVTQADRLQADALSAAASSA